jgi:murein DD-endopeptidase MepM/ murein hydrolase activator NlpD
MITVIPTRAFALVVIILLTSCAVGVGKPVLQMPLTTFKVEQHFGEYLGTYEGIVYGGYHTGTDLIAAPDTPVLAMAAGKVIRLGALFNDPAAGGWYSVIDHPALGIHTLYLHTKEPNVRMGDWVQAGQVIAYIIQPTRFPAHLHIEVKPRNMPIRKADDSIAYFVNPKTIPVGNQGYVISQNDLQRYWIDPETLIDLK